MQLRRERVLLLVLLLAVIGVWWAAFASASPYLTITMLDVGQGDSILVESPGGQTMLVDGGGLVGENTRGYDIGRDVVLPALLARRVKKIDVLVITHPHEDHVGGLLAVVQQVPVGLVLDPELEDDNAPYLALRKLIAEKRIPRRRATEGQQLNLKGGVRLEILHPPDPRLHGFGSETNNNSVVMRLTYGVFTMLLAGDIETLGGQRLARLGPGVRCTVLKVPHHGSAGAAKSNLFRTVHPQLALISVGAHNQFGHPTPETLEALREAGAYVMRTDRDGAITLRVNPPRWWAKGYVGGAHPTRYSGTSP